MRKTFAAVYRQEFSGLKILYDREKLTIYIDDNCPADLWIDRVERDGAQTGKQAGGYVKEVRNQKWMRRTIHKC